MVVNSWPLERQLKIGHENDVVSDTYSITWLR